MRAHLAWLSLLCVGCADSFGGCTLLSKTPGGFQGQRVDSAASVRLTPSGFAAVNGHAQELLERFAPGNTITVQVPCSLQSVAIIGQLAFADEGQPFCTSESCGQLDGKCDAKDEPHVFDMTITDLTLGPQAPDRLVANVTLAVATGKIMVSTVSRSSPVCGFSAPAKCSVDFDTARAGLPTNPVSIPVQFAFDPRWDKLLELKVPSLGGTTLCGGGASPPACLDPNDAVVGTEGSCNACTAVDWGPVKALVLQRVVDALRGTIERVLTRKECRVCETDLDCPQQPQVGSECRYRADAGPSDAGLCFDTGTGLCVPSSIGIEGRLDVGALLPGLTSGPGAIDLSLVAGGGAAASDAGLSIAARGGALAAPASTCVPRLDPPPAVADALPDLDFGSFGRPYDVGFSLSRQVLARVLFGLQQSGALCTELGHEQVAALESDVLATVMPSLRKLTHGNVPLRVHLRPKTVPQVELGEGGVSPAGEPIAPLVTLRFEQLELDVYALLDDRFARLFTVRLDLSLPLGLAVTGCSELTPVLLDLKNATQNVHLVNSELLPESESTIVAFVPVVISALEPTLGKGLGALTVPSVEGFQAKLLDVRGVGPVTSRHAAIYAGLFDAGEACPAVSVRSVELKLGPERLPGEVQLELPRDGAWLVRVDGGLFQLVRVVGGRATLSHPRLRLGERHVVDARALFGPFSASASLDR